MRKIWPLPILGAALACLAVTLSAQPAQSPAAAGYLTPPKVIADLMDAEPLPTVVVSPASVSSWKTSLAWTYMISEGSPATARLIIAARALEPPAMGRSTQVPPAA